MFLMKSFLPSIEKMMAGLENPGVEEGDNLIFMKTGSHFKLLHWLVCLAYNYLLIKKN